MSVTTEPAAIITIAITCPGITAGVDPPPPQIDTASLPFVYVLTRDGDYDTDTFGSETVGETRQYALQVPVIPTNQGTPDERETRCRPLIVAMVNTMLKYPTLNGLIGTRLAYPVRATGPAVLPEYGGKFIGFELTLTVESIFVRTYASEE